MERLTMVVVIPQHWQAYEGRSLGLIPVLVLGIFGVKK